MRGFVKFLFYIFIIVTMVIVFYFVPERKLNVDYISQYPNMPNGCEITSLTMVMNYNGYSISKEFLSDNFLDKSGMSNANPDLAYIGNPYKNGYYSYAGPIVNSANKYFKSIGVSKVAIDKTGMSLFGVLNKVIFEKKPVIVWYTVDDKSPELSDDTYIDGNGVRQNLYSNLHCTVVEGTGRGMVKVVDPIKGERSINFLQFAKLYYEMGQRAVVI